MKKHTGVVSKRFVVENTSAYVLAGNNSYHILRYAGRAPYQQPKELESILGRIVEFNGQILGRYLFVKDWKDYKIIDRDFNLGF